jgi:hypothetical protein
VVGANSRQVTALAVAEQAIQVTRSVGTDHDGLLSVPIAGITVHQYPAPQSQCSYSTSSRSGEEASRKTPFNWPFTAEFSAKPRLLRTVKSAPAMLVLIKPAALLMCEFSMTTGAVVATVTAGVLPSVLRQFPE